MPRVEGWARNIMNENIKWREGVLFAAAKSEGTGGAVGSGVVGCRATTRTYQHVAEGVRRVIHPFVIIGWVCKFVINTGIVPLAPGTECCAAVIIMAVI